MSEETDKVFQQYRQSGILYSATVISVTLALSAVLVFGERTLSLLRQCPALRLSTIGLVFLILLMASAIQYLVFRGAYLHANRFVSTVIAESEARWRKGNEAFSAADRLTRGVFFLFVAFLVVAAVIIGLARP